MIFNWNIGNVHCDMFVKEHRHFKELSVEDYGFNPTDSDARIPQLLCITKTEKTGTEGPTHVAFHARSERGKAHDAQRKNDKRRARRKAAAIARDGYGKTTKAATSRGPGSVSGPPKSYWEPVSPPTKASSSKASSSKDPAHFTVDTQALLVGLDKS